LCELNLQSDKQQYNKYSADFSFLYTVQYINIEEKLQKKLCLLLSFYYSANSASIANSKKTQKKQYRKREQKDCQLYSRIAIDVNLSKILQQFCYIYLRQ